MDELKVIREYLEDLRPLKDTVQRIEQRLANVESDNVNIKIILREHDEFMREHQEFVREQRAFVKGHKKFIQDHNRRITRLEHTR